MTNERHVLKLTVEESDAGCRIVAESNSKEREVEVGMLPDDFRKNLASLQAAIFRAREPAPPSHRCFEKTTRRPTTKPVFVPPREH